jgi:hypothetical protein
MVAPVVLITLGVIFSNSLLTFTTTFANTVLELDRERLGILRGPHGEMLDEDSVPPNDRERLRQISDVQPRMVSRLEQSRTALLIIWVAIGLLVLSVGAIAVAITARSEAFAFAALALVLGGVAGVFAGIAAVVVSLARRADAPIEAIRHRGVHGLGDSHALRLIRGACSGPERSRPSAIQRTVLRTSSPGHCQRMSLSPVSAISDMVAPVVLITLATIFANGLLSAGTAVRDRVFALNQERRGLLRGRRDEMLDEDSVPPSDRERLTEIRAEMPMMMRRIGRIRNAILIIWNTVGLLVLSVAAIAVAVTARSEAFAFTALALVIAGVAGVFAAVAAMIGPAARSTNVLIQETRRSGVLD